MNTAKIAALYANPIFNTLLRFPDFDTTTTLTEQVMAYVLRKARETSQSEDGRHYEASASNPGRRERYTYKDDVGRRVNGFLEESITKRAADWIFNQMPGWPNEAVTRKHQGLADHDVFLVTVMGYGRHAEDPEQDIESRAGYYFGAEADLQKLMRGLASIRRKRRKQAKKLEAQLRAYHQEQLALANRQTWLRKGHWFNAEQAITTAARVDEPGIPFIGDTGLTREQCVKMDMYFWAVAAGSDMETSFPTGTGIALKQIHRSRELVEGAVYLYQREWDTAPRTMALGRAKLADRSRGHIRLQPDDRTDTVDMPLDWKNPMLKVFRVTHYTTHNGEPVMQAETQPVQAVTKQQPKKRRQLAHAA